MEYLYRAIYDDDVVFESTKKEEIDFFAGLMREKEKIKIIRAELVWWPVPPENSDEGVT